MTMSAIIPRLVITPGEPAGVGVDIVLQISQEAFPAELVIVADPELLQARAQQLQLSIREQEIDFQAPPRVHEKGVLNVCPVKLRAKVSAGELNSANSSYVLACLEQATDLCLQKKADALVTGPVQKSIINDAGIPFSGHTEFLAQRCGVAQSIMLFVVDELKVALMTTHIALMDVPKHITAEKLQTTLRLLHQGLQSQFGIPNPRILVCGLNPHAGEHGVLGREEIEIIEPALDQLRKQGFLLEGPLPADTAFTSHRLQQADVILAMYHDQALPVVKYMGFDRAVNVTLGLPIVRTSVDHGTALDIAGTGRANPGSLRAAINLAIRLALPV